MHKAQHKYVLARTLEDKRWEKNKTTFGNGVN